MFPLVCIYHFCCYHSERLQKLIDGLFEFCKKWHLIVSLSKTNVQIFGSKKSHYQFMTNGSKYVLPLSINMLVLLFQLKQNISLVKTKIIWLIKVEMQFML